MLYRLITLLILLLAAPAWGATYNIGPGQTYTTFAAFFAAVTPSADDVIDGGNNTFTENVVPNSSGTSGHPIIYQNFIVDGGDTRETIVNVNARNYLTFINVTANNSANHGFFFFNSSGIILTNCSANHNHNAAYFNVPAAGVAYVVDNSGTVAGPTITGGSFLDNKIGVYIGICNYTGSITNSTVSGITASNNLGAGIYLSGLKTVTVSGSTFNSNGDSVDAAEDYGIAINGCDDATIIGNTIVGTVYNDGIQVYGDADGLHSSHRFLIHGNLIQNSGGGGGIGDGIGIGVVDNQTAIGGVISNNIIANSAGNGIQLEHIWAGTPASVSIYGNTITGSQYSAVRVTSANFPAVLKNNIFSENGVADPDWWSEVKAIDSTTGLTTSNNVWYRTSGTRIVLYYNTYNYVTPLVLEDVTDFEATAVGADPLLNASYGLAGNSPAKDKGAVLYSYAAHPGDYLGNKIYGNGPDIGAIEYQDHTFGGWFFEMFIPTVFNLCASTNANCYTQP